MRSTQVTARIVALLCFAGTAGLAHAAGPDGGSCAYIAEADVTQIMSHPMKYGEEFDGGECTLVSAEDDPTLSVSVRVHPTLELYQQMSTAQGAEAVSGIGDQAVAVPMGASAMVVAHANGKSYLGAVYNASQSGAARAQAIAIARAVVAQF